MRVPSEILLILPYGFKLFKDYYFIRFYPRGFSHPVSKKSYVFLWYEFPCQKELLKLGEEFHTLNCVIVSL